MPQLPHNTLLLSVVPCRRYVRHDDGSITLVEVGPPVAYQLPGEQGANLTWYVFMSWVVVAPTKRRFHMRAVLRAPEGFERICELPPIETTLLSVHDFSVANVNFADLSLGEYLLSIEVDGRPCSIHSVKAVAGLPPPPQTW